MIIDHIIQNNDYNDLEEIIEAIIITDSKY